MFVLLLVLSSMGACGLSGSLGGLRAPPPPSEDGGEQGEGHASPTGDGELAARALLRAFWEAPMRRPLVVANVLFSALLLVAAGSWALLRPSAPWWTGQAIAANVSWTLLDAVHQGAVLWQYRARLIPLFDAELRARFPAERLVDSGVRGEHVLFGYLVLAALWGLLRLGVYGWAWRRSRSVEVRAALRAFGASGR